MPENIQKLLEYMNGEHLQFPFMAMAAGKPRLNFARITETLVTAALVGLFVNYVTVQTLKKEFEIELRHVRADIGKLQDKVDKMHSDLYRPIRLTK